MKCRMDALLNLSKNHLSIFWLEMAAALKTAGRCWLPPWRLFLASSERTKKSDIDLFQRWLLWSREVVNVFYEHYLFLWNISTYSETKNWWLGIFFVKFVLVAHCQLNFSICVVVNDENHFEWIGIRPDESISVPFRRLLRNSCYWFIRSANICCHINLISIPRVTLIRLSTAIFDGLRESPNIRWCITAMRKDRTFPPFLVHVVFIYTS